MFVWEISLLFIYISFVSVRFCCGTSVSLFYLLELETSFFFSCVSLPLGFGFCCEIFFFFGCVCFVGFLESLCCFFVLYDSSKVCPFCFLLLFLFLMFVFCHFFLRSRRLIFFFF